VERGGQGSAYQARAHTYIHRYTHIHTHIHKLTLTHTFTHTAPADQGPLDSNKGKASASGGECELAQGKDSCRMGCCEGSGPTLMSVCRLDTCVTVLDASTFKADLLSIEEMADR